MWLTCGFSACLFSFLFSTWSNGRGTNWGRLVQWNESTTSWSETLFWWGEGNGWKVSGTETGVPCGSSVSDLGGVVGCFRICTYFGWSLTNRANMDTVIWWISKMYWTRLFLLMCSNSVQNTFPSLILTVHLIWWRSLASLNCENSSPPSCRCFAPNSMQNIGRECTTLCLECCSSSHSHPWNAFSSFFPPFSKFSFHSHSMTRRLFAYDMFWRWFAFFSNTMILVGFAIPSFMMFSFALCWW